MLLYAAKTLVQMNPQTSQMPDCNLDCLHLTYALSYIISSLQTDHNAGLGVQLPSFTGAPDQEQSHCVLPVPINSGKGSSVESDMDSFGFGWNCTHSRFRLALTALGNVSQILLPGKLLMHPWASHDLSNACRFRDHFSSTAPLAT